MSIVFRIKPIDPDYPYLIVHLYVTVYQHVNICFRETQEECTHRGFLEVVCKQPYKPDGTLTDVARNILVEEVRKKVAKEDFPMCIVLGPDRALFVELDGSINESNTPPYTSFEGTDMEVYDHGRMPTREALTVHPSGTVPDEIAGESDNRLERVPKIYYSKTGEKDGKNIVRPILSFSDYWEAANSPYWLLCLLRWMGTPDPDGLKNYVLYCASQIDEFRNSGRADTPASHVNDIQRAMEALHEDVWLAAWRITELFASNCGEQGNEDYSNRPSLAWSKSTAAQLRNFVGNPFEANEVLHIPLNLEDALWHYFYGRPVLRDDGNLGFQMGRHSVSGDNK